MSHLFIWQRLPRSSLTPPHPSQVPNWPWFRDFRLSPFVSVFALVGQMCAPTTVTGCRFSTSPPRLSVLVNGGPNVSSLRPNNSNRALLVSGGAVVVLRGTA